MNKENSLNLRGIMDDLRKKYGFLAKDLAVAMEISPQYLSAIEQGKRRVPKNFIQDLSSILPLTEEEEGCLHSAIVKINGENYVYEDMKKDLINDIHKLFVQLTADNYQPEVLRNMRLKLAHIRHTQKRKEKIAA